MMVSFCKIFQTANKIIKLPNSTKKYRNGFQNKSKKAPSYTYPKGSYTLEATVIFPFFAAFLVSIMFFFRVIQVETETKQALYYSSRMVALACAGDDSGSISLATAKALMIKELSKYELIDEYVSGGKYGISIIDSNMDGENVELVAKYKIKLPIGFFDIDGIKIEQHSNSKKWIGKSVENQEDDPYVYITENGTVYHMSDQCNYLDLSIKCTDASQIGRLRNKNGGKYSACSCTKKNKNNSQGSYYVTDYGDKYHSSLNCSGLKRTVKMIHLSEVNGMGACSKCGK